MNEKIKYFSMFTGVGGFELGFEKASQERDKESWADSSMSDREPSAQRRSESTFTCIGFSEIDKYASQLLAKRFPDVPNYGDATKINPSELPDFNMLCGGFPCQAFSIAGKRRGFEDTRGTMFFHIARILAVKRPQLVFLENVKGLLNHNEGETFKVILQTLEELGYDVQWMVLNSKFFGVPQNRERVFIIGSLRGTSRPEVLPFRTNEQTFTKQYQTETSGCVTSRYFKQGNADTYVREQIVHGSQGYRVYGTEGTSVTLAGQAGGVGAKTGLYQTQSKIRRLTPTECERLQGFPDGWTEGFSDTQRYKMMGNAVTVNVINAIAKRLARNALELRG